MFGLSGEHLLVILVILLIFGPKRLPDLGNSLGRTLKNFKDAMNGKEEVRAPVVMAAPSAAPQQLTNVAQATSTVADAQPVEQTITHS